MSITLAALLFYQSCFVTRPSSMSTSTTPTGPSNLNNRLFRIMRRCIRCSGRPRKIVRGPRGENFPPPAQIYASAQTIFLSIQPQGTDLSCTPMHYPDEANNPHASIVGISRLIFDTLPNVITRRPYHNRDGNPTVGPLLCQDRFRNLGAYS